MKVGRLIFIIVCNLAAGNSRSQNVGIGTTNPLTRFHVTDSTVLFSATGDIPGTVGFVPVQGAGRRMMWYPGKAAFRAGYVNGTQWDNNNIGTYSTATGFGTIANQGYSTAMGFFSKASGVASMAIGNQTTAKGFGAFSIGSLNDATDNPDPLNPAATDRIFQIGNGFGFFPNNALTVLRNGNVGIGYNLPIVPLSFNGSLGDKISLWTDGTPTHYGFGVQSSLLQMFAKTSLDDIGFGYGSSTSFVEAMRIKGNGNVGIGRTDPQFRLDINGRMRLSGATPNDPGIWLNSAGADVAFIGLENGSYVGFYGNQGAGWKFAMNTQTGALKVNGSEGFSGSVLTSNGPGSTASWASPPAKPYAFSTKPTQFTTLNGALLSKDINQVDNTPLVLAQASTVLYTLSAPLAGNGPGSINSSGYMVVEIVNGLGTRMSYASCDYYILRSTRVTQTASGVALNLPAGTYTIKARLVRLAIGDGDVDTHASFNTSQQGIELIVQVLPN